MNLEQLQRDTVDRCAERPLLCALVGVGVILLTLVASECWDCKWCLP